MSKLSQVLLISVTSLAMIGLASPTRPDVRPARSTEGSAHDFDFMLGSWTFAGVSTNPNYPAHFRGRWTAERSGDNALIEDDYRVVDDSAEVKYGGRTYRPGETIYLGVTYCAFDATTKRWATAFVQPPGATWSLGTAWRDGEMIREAPSDGSPSSRSRFYEIGPNHFAWSFDVSRDSGKTWLADVIRVEATRTSRSKSSGVGLR
jgi:hypothetical protein